MLNQIVEQKINQNQQLKNKTQIQGKIKSKQITLEEIKGKKYEVPIIYENRMLFFMTTDFDKQTYFNILEKYTELPYPILVDSNNIPLLDEKGEPLRDFTDSKINEYNYKQNKYKMAEIFRLVVREFEIPETIEETVNFLDNISSDLYSLIEKGIYQILNFKFVTIPEEQRKMYRQLLSASKYEKIINDRNNKKFEQEKDRLNRKIKVLRDKYIRIKDENEKQEIKNKVEELENRLNELYKKYGKLKDGYSYNYGVKVYGSYCQLKKDYHISDEIFMKLLENNLNTKEQLMVDILYTDMILCNESTEKRIKELEDRNKYNKNKYNKNKYEHDT